MRGVGGEHKMEEINYLYRPIITILAKCPNLPKMDPKCAKYPKVVLGRPVEGRSCKLHGKAPLTGPYTPSGGLMMRKRMLHM